MSVMQNILTAVALYLVIEGLIPFVGPDFFRRNVVRLAQLEDNHLRTVGLLVMMTGLILLFLVRR